MTSDCLHVCTSDSPRQAGRHTLPLEVPQSDRIKMSSDSESTANSSSDENQSPDSTSEHEITAIASIFQLYRDEPLARAVQVGHAENGHRVDEDGDPNLLPFSTLEERFEGRSSVKTWCKCSLCNASKLFGAREYRCCREVAEAYGKVVFEGLDLSCVVQHEDFRALTNKTVLLQVGPLLKDKEGRRYRRKKDQSENE